MRHCPRDSPQAAGRILALGLLSDGHLCKREPDRLDAHSALGQGRTALHSLVHSSCKDMRSSMHLSWDAACQMDQATLAALMADSDDPALQQQLLLCLAIADADDHVAGGGSVMLMAAIGHWGLQREVLGPRPGNSALPA